MWRIGRMMNPRDDEWDSKATLEQSDIGSNSDGHFDVVEDEQSTLIAMEAGKKMGLCEENEPSHVLKTVIKEMVFYV